MIENHLIGLLISTLSIVGTLFLILWIYKDYATDSFRQQMFAIRDALFDEAYNGLVDFNHPAYGLLRGTMNGYIRFGHKLRLLEALIFVLLVRKDADISTNKLSFDKRWVKATSELNPSVVERLNGYRLQMQRTVLKHLILGSPIFLAVFGFATMLVIPYLIKQKIAQFVEETFKRPLMEIQNAAMAEGEH